MADNGNSPVGDESADLAFCRAVLLRESLKYRL